MNKISTKTHWQNYWQRHDHQPMVIHEELVENLQSVIDVRGKKILEIGAGMGGDSIYLAKKGAEITTLDYTSEALQQIKTSAKKENVKVETVLSDAKNIPFADATFDVVFHQGFLEHFADPSLILSEQKRILKKGGYIVIDVPQRYTTYTVKKHILMFLGKWFAGWEKEFSVTGLEKLLKLAGFKIIRSYGWGYYGKLYNLRHLKMGKWYEVFWKQIEKSRIKLYLNWCIGVVAQKI